MSCQGPHILTCSPVQAFETTDFTDVRPLFPPLLHTICLVYSSSKYYNTSARIIVLLTVSSLKRGMSDAMIVLFRKLATC